MSSNESSRLRGRLLTTDPKELPSELQIEAFQRALTGADRRLGTAQCDPEGHFEIDQGPSAGPTQVSDRRPEVYFCVWHADRCVLNTKDEPSTPDPSEEVQVELPDGAIEAAQEASEDSATFSVRGRVVHPDGRTASDLVVQAFAVDGPEATDEVNLNEDVTDDEGQYCIPYQGQRDPTNGNAPPDLLVRAYEPGEAGQGDPVATSPIVVSPGRHQVVDLVVGDEPYRGPAEFDRVKAALDPLLENGDMDPSADRVSYLATKTGLTSDRITDYLQSRRLEEQSDAPAPAFYAMLREGMSSELTALSAVDPDTQQRIISRAADTNVVSPSVVEQVDELTEALQDSAIDRLLSAPPDAEGPTLKPVLDLVNLSEQNQRSLLERYRNHDGSVEAFWSNLQDDDEWGSDRVERIQTALQVGVLTRYDGNAAAALMDEFGEEDEPLRAMARLDADALMNLLESHGIPDDGDDGDAGTHARRITRLLEDAFPGWVLAHRLDDDDFDLAGNVAGFLKDHPEVDLRSTRVDSYLAENGDGVSDELRDGLRAVQRIFNIAPRHNKSRAIRTLLADDIDSGYAIQQMGKAAFSRRYEGQLEEAELKQVYANAKSAAATAQNLYAQHKLQRNGPPIYAMHGDPETDGSSDPPTDGIPELEGLGVFGSLDFCTCEHCRSIYSPAAYLVDLLSWLNERPVVDEWNEDGTPVSYSEDRMMLDVLTDRRPDLVQIDLTCENTNTRLPYVDLVNEVLEEEVVSTPETPQTGEDAETLRVQPEHLNPAAYDELAQAFYPWDLPFDLWMEEARTYLGHLGVSRAQLIDRLGDHASGSTSRRVASERLGMTELDWSIVAGETSVDAYELWGWDGLWDGEEHGWKASLERKVSTLLDHSGLAYEELEDLLRSRYLNPEGEIFVRHSAPDCDLDHAELANRPDNGFFDRMHRFVRLTRRLDWSPRQLDTALAAIPPHELSGTFLKRLGEIVVLKDRTGADLEEVLSWSAGLDTHDWGQDPSLYSRRFQNESVANPTDDPDDPFDLADTSESIGEHLPAIQAALEVTSDEMELLIETQLDDGATDSDHTLDLENLSKLYRVVSLANAVDLPVRDLVVLIELSGRDPFDATAPQETTAFVEEVERVKGSDFDAAELDYLFRHRRRPGAPVAILDAAVGRTLTDLRDELNALEEEHRIVEGKPLADQTREALSAVLSEEDVDRAMALLDQTSDEDSADPETFIEDQFGIFLDTEEVEELKDKLVSDTDDAAVEDPYRDVLRPLLDHLLRKKRQDTVVQKLSEALDTDPGAVSSLLREILTSQSNPAEPAMEDYLDSDFLYSKAEPLEPGDTPDAFEQFRRLEKILRLMEGFDVPEGEVHWLIEHGPEFGLVELRALPVSVDEGDATAHFEAWVEMDRLTEMRPVFAKGEGGILRILEAVQLDDGFSEVELLHELTGWSRDDVTFLLGPDGFAPTFPAPSTPEKTLPVLWRLTRAFDVLDRLGVSAESAMGWARNPPTQEQARAIKQAVRSRYDEETWFDIAEPLRDDLRDKQREALVAYLVDELPDKKVEDVEDLFGHLLLDVEMTSCMMTSRIKQAIASVQLFIQRCRMNLEPRCVLTEDDAREWEWRKNYRVWESNRKVFLYPENWIEPELRQDKSPFFEDLESDLLQAEINDENVEQAYRDYLEKLDDVARLETVGCHVETRKGESDTIHVLGRTRDPPKEYFYRRLEDGARWTPWEPVDADIEGDHVMPVVFNRRLRIIWPVFVPKAEEDVPPKETSKASEPNKYWEIQLAWSELRNGKWTPKKITDATVETNDRYDKSTIWFNAGIEGGRLVVKIWHYPSPDDPSDDDGNAIIDIGQLVFTGTGKQVVKDSSWQPLPPLIEEGSRIAGDWGPQPSTQIWYNKYRERSARPYPGMLFTPSKDLELYARTTADGDENTFGLEPTVILEETPGRFELVPPHQNRYRSQEPLFFQDEDRTFFVDPYLRTRFTPPAGNGGIHSPWVNPEHVHPEIYKRFDGAMQEPPTLGTGPSERARGGDGGPEPSSNPGIVGEDVVVAGGDTPVSPLGTLDGDNPRPTDDVSGGTTSGTETVMMAQSASDAVDSVGTAPSYAIDVESDETPAAGSARGFQTMSQTGRTMSTDDLVAGWMTSYRFHTFYHPYVGRFIQQLNRYGVEGFLSPSTSQDTYGLARQQKEEEYFEDTYEPVKGIVDDNYPKDEIDFDPGGAYSQYNWELFFHAPVLVAKQLSRNQRFQEAQEWFHYVFDPTDASDNPVPERFWNVKPFHENPGGRSIDELLALLTRDDLDPEEQKARENLKLQIKRWEDRPFKPHVIARLRESAYQRYVVMEYLDNLIAWGDELFRRGSLEDLNEATQIYILAREILGDRPETVSRSEDEREITTEDGDPVDTFEELEPHLDDHIHALVELETPLGRSGNGASGESDDSPELHLGPVFFFCIPRNDKLLEYWDTVDDRLYKIRHCLNIEGEFEMPPLFEPPIDPGVMVEAAAAGVDISSVMSDLDAPLPNYRFRSMLPKAQELVNEVQSLGASLLQALEKRDAEELALLRSTQETSVLEAAKEVRERRVEEAKESLEALKRSRELAEKRREYYDSREYRNAPEQDQEKHLKESQKSRKKSQSLNTLAALLGYLPDFDIGNAGVSSPVVKARWGSSNLISLLRAESQAASNVASTQQYRARMASIKGGHDRRMDNWKFQAEQASKQIEEIDKKIAAAKIRLEVAKKELENQELRIENSKEVSDLMEEKFTNQELYNWMVDQISSVYYQSYQLAHDLAKQCERAYQHELGDWDASFVEFGHWESLRKGLLAGERLSKDLHQMEAAYRERNKREHEMTKHVSLSMLDPVAVEMLKQTGRCHVRLPEALFDIDHPGHYMRRIKTVSLSIPCVTGPYTNVPAELTLLNSEIRTDPDPKPESDGGYGRTPSGDNRFRDIVGTAESIVTSSANRDSGLFETNLQDERYLPFEGAGVISTWRIELPTEIRPFDYDTISDVVLHTRYTARDGGQQLKTAAENSLRRRLNAAAHPDTEEGLFEAVSLASDAPDAWHQLSTPSGDTVTEVDMGTDQFPAIFRDEGIKINEVVLLMEPREAASDEIAQTDAVTVNVTLTDGSTTEITLTPSERLTGLLESPPTNLDLAVEPGNWEIEITDIPAPLADDGGQLDPEKVEDIVIVPGYQIDE